MTSTLKQFILNEIKNFNLKNFDTKFPMAPGLAPDNETDIGFRQKHDDVLFNRLMYFNKKYKLLGTGSARRVYAVSSKKVLKLALDVKGIAQNRTEVNIFTNPKTKPIVARIFDTASDYTWIVSEAVQEMTPERFRATTGISKELFKFLVFELETEQAPVVIENFRDKLNRQADYFKEKGDLEAAQKAEESAARQIKALTDNIVILDGVHQLMTSYSLLPGDLWKSHHWGKAPDGRVVNLDYGFTDDIQFRYYANG
jgi:hypothetical protein